MRPIWRAREAASRVIAKSPAALRLIVLVDAQSLSIGQSAEIDSFPVTDGT
jgi:hypothetical protein